MAVPTPSSSARARRNPRAWASLLLGLVAAAALPAGIALAEVLQRIDLLEAAAGIPVAAVAGVAALVLARGARERLRRTFGRIGGRWPARVGRVLGALGVAMALSGSIAVAFYEVLTRLSD